MKRIFTLICTLAMTATTLLAQEAEFPHDILDSLGIPPIPGAKCVAVVINEPDKKYEVYFDATRSQIAEWMNLVEKKGMMHQKKYDYQKERLTREVEKYGAVDYQFPMDNPPMLLLIDWNFRKGAGGATVKSGGREIPYTALLFLRYVGSPKLELDYPKGILGEFGVTDESCFIPPNTIKFTASVIRADGRAYTNFPAGTPVSGVLEAKFCAGYLPTFAQASKWASALYRACSVNASAIEPLAENEELPTSHWWTYTYRGVQYQCYVSIDLDLMGSFTFTIRRL